MGMREFGKVGAWKGGKLGRREIGNVGVWECGTLAMREPRAAPHSL